MDEKTTPAPNPFLELVKQGKTPAEAVKILEAQHPAPPAAAAPPEAKAPEVKYGPDPAPPKDEKLEGAVAEPPKMVWSGMGKRIPTGPFYPKRMWHADGVHAMRVVQSLAEERSMGPGWSDKAPVPAKPAPIGQPIPAKRLIPGFKSPHAVDSELHATPIVPKV
jgi:hypothetical protein